MKQLIVAHANDRSIGEQGKLPWQGLMPRDMQRFRAETMGNAVIMGRLTFESIGRPLPGRDNVVLTTKETAIPGCRVVSTLEEGFEVTKDSEHVFIIGGSSVYYSALPMIEKLVITRIDAEFPNADTHFPEIDLAVWTCTASHYFAPDVANQYGCYFEEYERTSHEKTT